MPVGTSARPPPASSVTSWRASRSSPASLSRAYVGSGNSGSRRTTGRASTRSSVGEAGERAGGAVDSPPVLTWMDLEMTGLDPNKDVIVEIATLVTDDELNIVAEG